MSLRRTSQNPALVEDALRRLRCLGWQGAAMLEYRVRDSDGSFDFIELNPRYWQSLHLDLLAGIDFPRSEEHTSELQSLMRISYAVFCLKKKKRKHERDIQTYRIHTTIHENEKIEIKHKKYSRA